MLTKIVPADFPGIMHISFLQLYAMSLCSMPYMSCVFDASPTQSISSLKRFYCASFSCLIACEK